MKNRPDEPRIVEYFKLKRRAHCWVQLTEEKANKLEEALTKPPLQNNVSYNYTTPDGVQMREYHVDTHKAFCGTLCQPTIHNMVEI
jgi:hypothetical protein